MGLDMYLNGIRYFGIGHPNRELEPALKMEILDLGYWRKHPNLHGYIVKEFADGKDECQEIGLAKDDLLKIIEAIKDKSLPPTEGFFFGISEESDGQREEDLEIIRAALEWLDCEDSPFVSRYINYRASW